MLGMWLGPAVAATGARPRELELLNLHTGESLRSRYWHDGLYLDEELARLSWLLRDHRTGAVRAIDPKLLDLLHALRHLTNAESPFHIVSGYRSPQTNAALRKRGSGVARRSYHMLGRAVDVRIPRVDLAQLRQAAVALKVGGVGYYRKGGYVHVDTGPVRFW
jgi:uncharacterized protein YcbK (DUF882 family)